MSGLVYLSRGGLIYISANDPFFDPTDNRVRVPFGQDLADLGVHFLKMSHCDFRLVAKATFGVAGIF